jgi:WD40 repeat protein
MASTGEDWATRSDTADEADTGWGDFHAHHAFIVGINAYRSPLRCLTSAVPDAMELARVLRTEHGFTVHEPLLNGAASKAGLLALFKTMQQIVGPDDRVVFYFAGHGVALTDTKGPAGFLVPSDAERDAQGSLLAMDEVSQALKALPCRHLLVILDCCFAGSFRWASAQRDATLVPHVIYREVFDFFVKDKAWQVLTSAAHDQRALDVVDQRPLGGRDGNGPAGTSIHSPFAQALFDGLRGAADLCGARAADGTPGEGDGVITATELYLYLRMQVESRTAEQDEALRQTPGLFPIGGHHKGEFVFLRPGPRSPLKPMPAQLSPYKGLFSFELDDAALFYGRKRVIAALQDMAVTKGRRLIVVTGASGTGKSSVVKAGLLPVLREAGFHLLPPIRPGAEPLQALQRAVHDAPPNAVLVVDQLEEVVTRRGPAVQGDTVLAEFDAALARLLLPGSPVQRLVLTVRSDFEPHFSSGAQLKAHWRAARYVVPPLDLGELREVVVMPAVQAALKFESPELVDDIVKEVVQSPGALPLLSYAMSELFRCYLERQRTLGKQLDSYDRTLRRADYAATGGDGGGVIGALTTKADRLLASFDAASRDALRRVLLRMVSLEGALAGRRVAEDDIAVSDDDVPLVHDVVEALVQARLVVKTSEGGVDSIEPAHDALVRAWPQVTTWIREATRDGLLLVARVAAAAADHAQEPAAGRRNQLLWHRNPNLPLARRAMEAPDALFNRRERRFIAGSVELREDERRAARAAEDAATAQRLAALAEVLAPSSSDLCALVAIESTTLHPTPLARALIAEAAARTAQCMVLRSDRRIKKAWLSADGSAVLTENSRSRASLWDAATWAPRGPFRLPGTDGRVVKLSDPAVSPDGRRFATRDSDALHIWDLASGEQRLHIEARWCRNLVFSPDGSRIAASFESSLNADFSANVALAVWDAASGQRLLTMPLTTFQADTVYSLDWMPNGAGLLFRGNDSAWRVWHFGSPTEPASSGTTDTVDVEQLSERLLADPMDPATRLLAIDAAPALLSAGHLSAFAASPRGDVVVYCGKQGRAPGDDGQALRGWIRSTVPGLGGPAIPALGNWVPWRPHHGVTSIVVAPDSTRFAAVSRDGTVRLVDVASGQMCGALAGQHGGVADVCFAQDGSAILTAGTDGHVRVWGPDGALQQTLRGDGAALTSARFSEAGDRILTLSFDGTARLWPRELDSARWALEIDLPQDTWMYAQPMSFSPDGSQALVCRNGVVQLVAVRPGQVQDMPRVFTRTRGTPYMAVLSPEGQRVLTVATDHVAEMHDVASAALVCTLGSDLVPVQRAMFSPDGRWVLSSCGFGQDQQVVVWDAATREVVCRLSDPTHSIDHMAWSPNSRTVVTVGREAEGDFNRVYTLRLWDREGQRPWHAVQLGGRGARINGFLVSRLAVTPDDKHIFVQSAGDCALMSAATGKKLLALEEGIAEMSLDGSVVAHCPNDLGGLQLWDVASRRARDVRLEGATRGQALRFSRDGRFFVVLTTDGTPRLVDVAAGRVLRRLACGGRKAYDAAFSADGSVVSVVTTSAILQWPCEAAQPLGTLIAQVKGKVGRELTAEERLNYGLPRPRAPLS